MFRPIELTGLPSIVPKPCFWRSCERSDRTRLTGVPLEAQVLAADRIQLITAVCRAAGVVSVSGSRAFSPGHCQAEYVDVVCH